LADICHSGSIFAIFSVKTAQSVAEKPKISILLKIVIAIAITLSGASCKKDSPDDAPEAGKITLQFSHYNEGSPLNTDTMMYTNEAGNPYLVNEIQYFISDVTIHYEDGREILIDAWKEIHYVDTDIPSTHEWQVFDELPPGTVTSISFTFGIPEEKNQSLMFTDPPESLMFWPEYLGGGYHYLKLNGKWLADDNIVKPFDFHLGIGQVYDSEGSITGFIQNYFTVRGLNSPFDITPASTQNIVIRMNVENWFENPHTYDHNIWGGDIMQKQEAMNLGCENGADVFEVLVISTED
jgi:hypothetical protein